ncbi:MAG: hypothetical protein Gaeavirus35_5 [Gaeavirus sp.]|uniref:Uncharacterized protein n=1 Tax=Gaeavirus sp. TaxID=2487767 RepID=A0A3G4ZZJ3_9VIRU|nr:MAG: hypothetical protein Gaeavirus35_5 [Gaeavirus sp.]
MHRQFEKYRTFDEIENFTRTTIHKITVIHTEFDIPMGQCGMYSDDNVFYICVTHFEQNLQKYKFVTTIKRISFSIMNESFSDLTPFINLEEITVNVGITNISNLIMPNSLNTLHIHDDCSLADVTIPSNLKILILGIHFKNSLTNVKFPDALEEIDIWTGKSLTGSILPKFLKKITIHSQECLTALNDMILPTSLQTLDLQISRLQHKTSIPSNFINVRTDARFIPNLIFPSSITKLCITTSIRTLNNLPNGLEELEIIDVSDDVTNLPSSITKIIINSPHVILSKFKRIPYGCVVMNANGNILLK